MKTLYTFLPDRLNLNGSQGNLTVLRARLEWSGEVVSTVSIDSVEKLLELSEKPELCENAILFIGHGSLETQQFLAMSEELLRKSLHSLSEIGLPTLIVGTVYELLFGSSRLDTFRSEFVRTLFSPLGMEVMGYVATGYDLEPIQMTKNSTVWALMHGPILAKNPKLADWFLGRVGVHNKDSNSRIVSIDSIVDRIWELEAKN